MIVNPSYIYAGPEIAPADPNVFVNGVVSVPYSLSGGAAYQDATKRFAIPSSGFVKFTIPAKSYKNVKITMNRSYYGSSGTTAAITFAAKTGDSTVVNRTVYDPKSDHNIPIPENFQINDLDLTIQCATSGSTLYLYEIVLS